MYLVYLTYSLHSYLVTWLPGYLVTCALATLWVLDHCLFTLFGSFQEFRQAFFCSFFGRKRSDILTFTG